MAVCQISLMSGWSLLCSDRGAHLAAAEEAPPSTPGEQLAAGAQTEKETAQAPVEDGDAGEEARVAAEKAEKAMAEAKAFGDVALMAEGYAGAFAKYLGVFELQEDVVQERPTYKKKGQKLFLFYNTAGCWLVGSDTSDPRGWWKVASAATTPGAITETWKVHDGHGWVEVSAAKIVQSAMSPRRRTFIEERTSK